jgi:hypothetical protein
MNRLLVLAALLAALIFPSAAGAQGGTIVNELRIRLWPEYDRSELLVIYNFTLAPGTITPTQLQFRVPPEAQVTAVAQDTPNGLFSVDFESSSEGDWQTVTFEAADLTGYQFEYYVPIHYYDEARLFNFIWPGDYNVNTLVVEVQEPSQTTEFSSTPTLPNESLSPDNLPIHSGTFGSIDEGEEWSLDVNYSRATDELTVSGQPVQPSGGAIDTEVSSTAAIMDFLSRNMYYILGFLGILLIVVGLVWYWQSGSSTASGDSRKRHGSRGGSEKSSSNEGQIYCHECGKRAQPSDKFCRACGVRLRREDA